MTTPLKLSTRLGDDGKTVLTAVSGLDPVTTVVSG